MVAAFKNGTSLEGYFKVRQEYWTRKCKLLRMLRFRASRLALELRGVETLHGDESFFWVAVKRLKISYHNGYVIVDMISFL